MNAGVDKPASESKQFATFRWSLLVLFAWGLACLVATTIAGGDVNALALGLGMLMAGHGGVGVGARAWHDRGVRIAALDAPLPRGGV